MQKKVLEILKDNSRLSNEDIAKMLDISVEKVVEIIKKLEADNVILKYSVIVNDEVLNGDDVTTAFIEVKVSPERDTGFDSIAKRLQKFPEVQSVYLMSGAYDLLVVIQGKSLQDVAKFVSSKLSAIDRVLSTSTHFLLKKYKENGVVMGNGEEHAARLNVSF